MIKNNQNDGFGDEPKSVPTNNKSSSNSAFPKRKEWESGIHLAAGTQAVLSDLIDSGLRELESLFAEFVTVNSRRSELRSGRNS